MRCLDCLKMNLVALTGKGAFPKDHAKTFFPQASVCKGGYPFLVDPLVERQCPKYRERKRKFKLGY